MKKLIALLLIVVLVLIATSALAYIGSSTRSEIEYANEHGKPVRYLEPGC